MKRFPQVVELYIRKYGDDGTFAFDDNVNAEALNALKAPTNQIQKNNSFTKPTQQKGGLDSLMADLGDFAMVCYYVLISLMNRIHRPSKIISICNSKKPKTSNSSNNIISNRMDKMSDCFKRKYQCSSETMMYLQIITTINYPLENCTSRR